MKKIWILGLILFLVFILPQVSFSRNQVRLYLFYSEETGGLRIEDEIIKPLSEKYPLEVKSFSVNQLKNYDLLVAFEKQLKTQEKELPVIVIGERGLGGKAEIRRDLEELVKVYAERGGTSWPSLQPTGIAEEEWIPRVPTEEEKKSGKIIYAAFVSMPGCLPSGEMNDE